MKTKAVEGQEVRWRACAVVSSVRGADWSVTVTTRSRAHGLFIDRAHLQTVYIQYDTRHVFCSVLYHGFWFCTALMRRERLSKIYTLLMFSLYAMTIVFSRPTNRYCLLYYYSQLPPINNTKHSATLYLIIHCSLSF